MKNFLVLLSCLSVLCLCGKSVKVSSFKPERADSTAAIQQALDSGAAKIIFDDPGFEYLSRPVFVRSNSELIFENGVTVRALPGAYKNKSDCLFNIRNAENVTLRGDGKAEIKMNKKDYQNPKRYSRSEWRHAISLLSCKNITIKDLTISSSGGDGIYVGLDRHSKSIPYCENVLLENLILDDHHRQGISIITAKNLLIRNCDLKNTSGTAPACGIDFEPNGRPGEVLENCVMEKCRLYGNDQAGMLVYAHIMRQPIDITVRDCKFYGNNIGLRLIPDNNDKDLISGTIKMENCTFSGNNTQVNISGLRGKMQISFKDCIVDNRRSKNIYAVGLLSTSKIPFAGVDFGNMVIYQKSAKNVIGFETKSGAALGKLDGSVTVIDATGKKSTVDLVKLAANNPGDPDLLNFQTAKMVSRNLLPQAPDAFANRKVRFFVRGRNVEFFQYSDGKNPVKITFDVVWKSPNYPDMPVQLEFVDQAGNSHQATTLKGSKTVYTFLPPKAGVYTFRIKNTQRKSLAISSDTRGFAFSAAVRNPFFRCRGKLYFQVPAGVKNVAIEVIGDTNEPVEAAIVNAQGKRVARVPYSSSRQLIKASRSDASKTELWSLEVIRAREDWSARLAAPLPPLFYIDPADVMTAR